jgi:hypothetical protein
MNTFLLTAQIVCYGVGIVSASLNIASVVRRWRTVTDQIEDVQ